MVRLQRRLAQLQHTYMQLQQWHEKAFCKPVLRRLIAEEVQIGSETVALCGPSSKKVLEVLSKQDTSHPCESCNQLI